MNRRNAIKTAVAAAAAPVIAKDAVAAVPSALDEIKAAAAVLDAQGVAPVGGYYILDPNATACLFDRASGEFRRMTEEDLYLDTQEANQ